MKIWQGQALHEGRELPWSKGLSSCLAAFLWLSFQKPRCGEPGVIWRLRYTNHPFYKGWLYRLAFGGQKCLLFGTKRNAKTLLFVKNSSRAKILSHAMQFLWLDMFPLPHGEKETHKRQGFEFGIQRSSLFGTYPKMRCIRPIWSNYTYFWIGKRTDKPKKSLLRHSPSPSAQVKLKELLQKCVSVKKSGGSELVGST